MPNAMRAIVELLSESRDLFNVSKADEREEWDDSSDGEDSQS